jgi:hypothetical protein
VAALLGVLAVAVVLVYPPVAVLDPGPYETTTVTLADGNGTELATVEARLADTAAKRRVGLMRTDTLQDGSGMLFVHPREGTYTYHMENVAFGIDIVFVGADGAVTAIYHASAPGPDGASDTYTGTGRYVLEVPRGFTNRTGLEAGDRVDIPDTLR